MTAAAVDWQRDNGKSDWIAEESERPRSLIRGVGGVRVKERFVNEYGVKKVFLTELTLSFISTNISISAAFV